MDHLPPQSPESEQAILGSVFIDDQCLDVILSIIKPDDLYREAHRKILNAMVQLQEMNEPCDLVTMVDLLGKCGELEEIGGAAYLLLLVDFVPTSANVVHYCKIVAEKSLDRRLITQAQETISMLHNGKSSTEVIDKIESNLVAMAVPQKLEPVGAAELVKESARRLRTRHSMKGQLQGMSWGITELNEATTGIQRGDLIIIAGRPSMGKTAFAGNVIRSACLTGKSALQFSLEMARVDCTDRYLADLGNIKYHHLRTGKLTDAEWAGNARACEEFRKLNLFIDDTPGVTFRQVKSKAKRQKRSAVGLDLLVVDYLQLMGISGRENRTQQLGEISRGLKVLARELDIAVVLLSQLNRDVDKRPDKRPLMSDLRDSGEIEQDADVIIFPFRPAAYCAKCRKKVNDESHNYWEHQAEAEIIIEKQRNGERNLSIPVLWSGQYQRFEGVGQLPL